MFLLIVLFVIFVVIAELVRKDAMHEGVDSKTAWYFGLLFGTLAVAMSAGLIVLVT